MIEIYVPSGAPEEITLIPTCMLDVDVTVTLFVPEAPVSVTPVAPAFALTQPVKDVAVIPV